MILSNFNEPVHTHFIIVINVTHSQSYFSAGLSAWEGTVFTLPDPQEHKVLQQVLRDISKTLYVRLAPSPAISTSIADALYCHTIEGASTLVGINIHSQEWDVIQHFKDRAAVEQFIKDGNHFVRD